MTPEERELLKAMAGAIGALSQALSDGVGLANLNELNQNILENVGAAFCKAFPSEATGHE